MTGTYQVIYSPEAVENYIVFYLAYKEKHIVLVNRIFYSGQDIRHIVQELGEQC